MAFPDMQLFRATHTSIVILMVILLQVVSGFRTCFCMFCFLDDHNFINNNPQYLKLVSNDAPFDSLQSALKIRL